MSTEREPLEPVKVPLGKGGAEVWIRPEVLRAILDCVKEWVNEDPSALDGTDTKDKFVRHIKNKKQC